MKSININACFAALLFALALSACSVDSNERANRLYSEAHQALASIDESDVTMDELIHAYSLATDKLERITSRYPGSDIAVGLLSGDRKLHGLTMRSIRERYKSFERLDTFDDLTLSVAAYLWTLTSEDYEASFINRRLSEGGLVNEALSLTSEIENPYTKAFIKLKIAIDNHSRLPSDEFQRITTDAEKTLSNLNSSREKALLLRNLSRAYYANDERDLAAERFNASFKEGLKLNEPDIKRHHLTDLLELHLETELSDEPSALANEAKRAIEEVDDAYRQVVGLARLATLTHKLGESESANELLVVAEALKSTIESGFNRSRAVNSLVRAFASIDDFETSLELASTNTYRDSEERAYLDIASAMLERGMTEDAISLSNSIESAQIRSSYHIALSDHYRASGNIAESLENLKRAEQLALSRDAPSEPKLIEIADGYAQIGALDNARELLSKVLSYTRDSTDDAFWAALNLTDIWITMRKHNLEITRSDEVLVTSIALSYTH